MVENVGPYILLNDDRQGKKFYFRVPQGQIDLRLKGFVNHVFFRARAQFFLKILSISKSDCPTSLS